MATTEEPVFAFAAQPQGRCVVPDLFADGPVRALLENPGALRRSGWDLQTQERAQIVKGERLEIALRSYKVIRLYADGTLFARVPGGADFLGWAATSSPSRPFWERPRLNPVSLSEFVYNFVDLYRRLTSHYVPVPQASTIRVSIRQAIVNGTALYLNPGGLRAAARELDFEWSRKLAPEPSAELNVGIEHTQLRAPEIAALSVVEAIYQWFGAEPADIPYVRASDHGRALDLDALRDGG
jgi:hypothetical protein